MQLALSAECTASRNNPARSVCRCKRRTKLWRLTGELEESPEDHVRSDPCEPISGPESHRLLVDVFRPRRLVREVYCRKKSSDADSVHLRRNAAEYSAQC